MMVHTERFASRSEATKAEYAFKQLTRAKKISYLHQQGINISD